MKTRFVRLALTPILLALLAITTSVRPIAADAASSNRASQMPWDSGGFAEEKTTTADNFVNERGRPLDVLSVYADVSSASRESQTWWLGVTPHNFTGTLAIGVPLWPLDSSVDDAANGNLDWMYRDIANGLANGGYGNAYVRLSWEMNIYTSSGTATPSNSAQWVKAFQRAVGVFRSVSPNFRIVFNPNVGDGQTGLQAEQVWPGDYYVDVVGVDAYDWWPAYNSDANWQYHYSSSHGLAFWMNFARTHGKKFALPEWGVARANAQSGGDDPRYIDYMFTWMRDNADEIAYESYFEESASYCLCSLSLNPQAKAQYAYWLGVLSR